MRRELGQELLGYVLDPHPSQHGHQPKSAWPRPERTVKQDGLRGSVDKQGRGGWRMDKELLCAEERFQLVSEGL